MLDSKTLDLLEEAWKRTIGGSDLDQQIFNVGARIHFGELIATARLHHKLMEEMANEFVSED